MTEAESVNGRQYHLWSSSMSASGVETNFLSLARKCIVITTIVSNTANGIISFTTSQICLLVHAALSLSGHFHAQGHASSWGRGHQAGDRHRTALVFINRHIICNTRDIIRGWDLNELTADNTFQNGACKSVSKTVALLKPELTPQKHYIPIRDWLLVAWISLNIFLT